MSAIDVLASHVTTTRERVALSLGPEPGDGGAYWQELSEWRDWTPWVDPDHVTAEIAQTQVTP